MNWKDIWMTLFALIVVVMNAGFWGMKPRKKATSEAKRT